MLSENLIKEEISYAYLHAVASQAGFKIDRPRIDDDSIDVTVSATGKLSSDSKIHSPKLDIQLKATSQVLPSSDEAISFFLKKKNHDDLRAASMAPRILVVLCLPDTRENWVSHGIENLIIKKCAYWANIALLPACTQETGETIYLHKRNHFSPEALKQIMEKIARLDPVGAGAGD
jgi:hypothetical protein